MFSQVDQIAGVQPFNDWFLPDTTQRSVLGVVVKGIDPFWGGGEFMYIKSNDAILKGSLVSWDGSFVGTLLPNTANQGFSFGVAMAPMAAGTYGWIQVSGRAVYKTGSTVAAGTAIGITAAGICGTLAAGKQLCGVRNVVSATGTVTVSGQTKTGSSAISTGGYDGFCLGLAVTGTGVPASSVVAALDRDGRTIYIGSAIGTIDKLATASAVVTITGTFTGLGVGMINHPFAQGAIT